MNIVDAINNCGDNWFRPVLWRNSGLAYSIKDGNTLIVPTASGGMENMAYSVRDLIGEWEIVTVDTVLSER